ncbi:hypothetical protein ASPZODRAFT_68734 [Penicilliopsis zonata CBS 506.65]|uniref:Major facilitator superfamily (MFS) profile domain-containing protein n=1 Tax=Penicilliopsis zonata CBS 506.65 TaxID=1073090 RepID=A0A1L9SEY0_9EURO|nr:hypothetical protein ASPZODRAFT_68734 [Penicilliopsis zonata CBS 506.65]OJJ45663.1 hypothetical protein ASPZODRAFT_68734 [Penicilliopsis zonata CBS 506.65]
MSIPTRMCVSLLLSTLETTIVSTALVSITNALDGFSRRDWIVTSYLLTYTGFLTIYAKFSDIFGRKVLFLLGIGIFVVFSILCGVSQSILTLIVLRAFQGLGASGIYSMVMVITPQVVPRTEVAKYMAIMSSVFALSSILGPVLGGIITAHPESWQWVFYLNGPVGAIAFLLIVIFLPSTPTDTAMFGLFYGKVPRRIGRRVDVAGALLLLAASLFLVFVFEEAGSRYAWASAIIIAMLVLACICWILFPAWEYYLQHKQAVQEPIFPVRLLNNRVMVGMMLYGFFTGFPFMAVIVNLTQRFQDVNGVSSLHAGIYLLPMLLCSPLASGASSFIVSKLKVAPFYLIAGAAVLQLVGVCLVGTLASTPLILQRQQFAYEVILGLSFGTGLSMLLVLAALTVAEKDMGVAMGALTQIRVLGGTLGLAICSTVFSNYTSSRLINVVDAATLQQISDSATYINSLAPAEQAAVRTVYAQGYALQMHVMAGFSGLVVLCSALIWQRNPRFTLSST